MSQFDTLFKKPESVTTRVRRSPKNRPESLAEMPVDLPRILEKKKKGKSDDPRFRQVLTYLKKETHNSVKAALIFDDQERDLSDLVEELLAGWLTAHQDD
jgi:hypothetical protein